MTDDFSSDDTGSGEGEGQSYEGWTDGLDRDVLEQIGGYENPQDMAKEFAKLRKEADGQRSLIGKRAEEVRNNPELAKAVLEHFPEYKAPESPDDYEYEIPEVVQENGWDANFEVEFRETAHELGIRQDQFTELMNLYGDFQAENLANQIEEVEHEARESNAVLREEYGRAYPAAKQDAEFAFEMIFPPHYQEQIMASGLLADYEFTKNLINLGQMLNGSAGLPGGQMKSGGGGQLTPEQAEMELDKMNEDPEVQEALADKMSDKGKKYKKKMEELAFMAYGD